MRAPIALAGQLAAVEPTMTGRENLDMVARLFGQPVAGLGPAPTPCWRWVSPTRLTAWRAPIRGGMRRRLDLGASLAGSPRLLLLDEPTTGLDPRSRMELWDAIGALMARGTDVLLTTQYLDHFGGVSDMGRVHATYPTRLPPAS